MHSNSLELIKRFGLPYFTPGTRVLEIGPDPDWLCRSMLEKLGVEYHYGDIKYDHLVDPLLVRMHSEYSFDCQEDSFEVVFSANVAEHVRKLWRWMAELARITKPGGHVICVNPVSWPYHEGPVDCWRLFPEAYKALFEEAALEHVFSWHGNLVPIDSHWFLQHGPQVVTDTIAIARKCA